MTPNDYKNMIALYAKPSQNLEQDIEVYKQMDKVYKNKLQFQKMSLVNISEAGRFAADRSIEDYARDIWHLKKLK